MLTGQYTIINYISQRNDFPRKKVEIRLSFSRESTIAHQKLYLSMCMNLLRKLPIVFPSSFHHILACILLPLQRNIQLTRVHNQCLCYIQPILMLLTGRDRQYTFETCSASRKCAWILILFIYTSPKRKFNRKVSAACSVTYASEFI